MRPGRAWRSAGRPTTRPRGRGRGRRASSACLGSAGVVAGWGGVPEIRLIDGTLLRYPFGWTKGRGGLYAKYAQTIALCIILCIQYGYTLASTTLASSYA